MDQATFTHEMTVNRRAYEAMSVKIRQDHAGKYVALAKGQLIAACSTYDDAVAAVQRMRPVPECYLVFPANEEPDFEAYDDF